MVFFMYMLMRCAMYHVVEYILELFKARALTKIAFRRIVKKLFDDIRQKVRNWSFANVVLVFRFLLMVPILIKNIVNWICNM